MLCKCIPWDIDRLIQGLRLAGMPEWADDIAGSVATRPSSAPEARSTRNATGAAANLPARAMTAAASRRSVALCAWESAVTPANTRPASNAGHRF